MSITDRVAKGVKATFGARIVDIAANAVLTVILARYLLTPDQFGLLFVVISILGVASMFGTLGFPSSVARYITEYSEKDRTQIPQILRYSVGVIITLSLIVAVALTVGNSLVARIIDEPGIEPLLVIGGVYILFEALSKYLSSVFQGLNRIELSALVNSVSAIGRLLFAVVFTLAGYGAVGALAGYAAGFALSVTVGGTILYQQYYRSIETAPQLEDGLFRRMVEYSVPLTATRGATVIDKKVDTILVGVLLNPLAAGFYTIGKQVSDASIAPASSLGFTISPAFGEDKAGDRLKNAAELYELAMKNILILYIPATVGLILVAEPMVVHVFGPDYRAAAPVVQVMSLFVLANSVNKITSDGLDFLGRARTRAIFKGGMAIANVILNLLLIPTLGVIGAAIATVITFSAYTILCVYLITTELPVTLRTVVRPVVKVTIISLGMGIVVLMLLPLVNGVITLLAIITAGVCVWAIGSTAWGLVDVRQVRAFIVS